MEDSIHHKQLRQKLLNHLHLKGIINVDVLKAMNKVPRHLFLDSELSAAASYEDSPYPIGHEQTISQPYTVAYQTNLLDVFPGDKVLEIGTGSGYQAAVLFEMGAKVYTIERIKKLYISAHRRLSLLGYTGIRTFYGDGNKGLEQFAPFDKIIATAEAPEIPMNLVKQLKKDGRFVLPVNGRMICITKNAHDVLNIEELDYFQFVPLLKGVVE